MSIKFWLRKFPFPCEFSCLYSLNMTAVANRQMQLKIQVFKLFHICKFAECMHATSHNIMNERKYFTVRSNNSCRNILCYTMCAVQAIIHAMKKVPHFLCRSIPTTLAPFSNKYYNSSLESLSGCLRRIPMNTESILVWYSRVKKVSNINIARIWLIIYLNDLNYDLLFYMVYIRVIAYKNYLVFKFN